MQGQQSKSRYRGRVAPLSFDMGEARKPSLSEAKAARIMIGLRSGSTPRRFAVKASRFDAYCKARPEFAREAIPLLADNLKAAHRRKAVRFKTMTHCKAGLHLMTGDNVRIHSNNGRRFCVACRKVSDARAPAMKAEEIGAVKRALQNGVTIGQICFGKPVGGGQVDRKLCLTTPRIFYRYRQENPDFDQFVVQAVAGNSYAGQQIRRSRARTRIRTAVAQEEANDYRRLLAMLPANFPHKDAVVSLIIEDLLTGALKREDVRARLQTYISAHNRMFPTKYAKFGNSRLVSLDARLFEDGAITLGDTISRGLWD
jgi:hypothetical protein